jgi:ribosomal silencing factor RsfS
MLLSCLGIQLNNRKKEEATKAVVTTKTSALNVIAIMKQAAKYRRDKIRPQSESENDDESSRWVIVSKLNKFVSFLSDNIVSIF